MKIIISITLFFYLAAVTLKAPEPLATKEVCLGGEEEKLYNLIMTYRRDKGLKSIPLSSKLTLVAKTHVRDLAEH